MLFDEELPPKLWDYLNNCSREELFNGLIAALDSMEQYNGQSKFSAICDGFQFEHGSKEGSYKIPVIPKPIIETVEVINKPKRNYTYFNVGSSIICSEDGKESVEAMCKNNYVAEAFTKIINDY